MNESQAHLFDRDGWWDPSCKAFASLRAVSAFRLDLLRRWLPGSWAGRRVVDLGCGGGLLGVPLAADRATVLGIDRARAALAAGLGRGEPRYGAAVGDLQEPPVAAGSADVVLLADVLEHVAEPRQVVARAAELLAPGGHLFVNTIARSRRSRLLAITLAEGLGYVPRGTHRWEDFVQPEELEAYATAAGLQRVQRVGEAPRLLATVRRGRIELREAKNLAVGYAALYRRAV